MFSSKNLGTLRIEKPRLTAKLSRQGSNVQAVFGYWFKDADGEAPAGVDLSLEVADGEAMIHDQDAQQDWHVVNIQLAMDLARQSPAPTRLEGTAAVQFDGAERYGFQVGSGELKLRLADGVLQSEPLQLSCNQGTITVQPELRLAAQPMEFRLSAGPLADHVRLDPAACHSGLKYVVPVLASATQSQGEFSVQLDGCRIPLGDLTKAEVGGRLIVHSATMSSGPIVRQLTPLLSSLPPLVDIPRDTVVLFA